MAVVNRIMLPRDADILIPRTYDSVGLHSRGEWRLKTDLKFLINLVQNRNIILAYPGVPSVIIRVLKHGRRIQKRVRERCGSGSSQRDAVSGFEEKGAMNQECRWPLEAAKGKDVDSLLKPPERTTLILAQCNLCQSSELYYSTIR